MPQLVQTLFKGDISKKEKEWEQYFFEKDSELEREYSMLLWGTKSRQNRGWRKVGYRRLRDFFDGDQWQYIPEGGQTMPVFNYCRSVVANYTSFLTNEPIDIDVPPSIMTDEVEVARAEAKEKVLIDVLEQNNFTSLFAAAAQNGSLLGDSVIVGPFYDEKKDSIILRHVKLPEDIKIIWADDEYKEIYGFIHNRYVSAEQLWEDYPEEIEERNIRLSTNDSTQDRTSAYSKSQRSLVRVRDMWTRDVNMITIGNKVLKFKVNKDRFVPITHVPNIIHPEEPYGVSDIEDLLDAQVAYNEKNSDLSEVIAQNAYDYIFGKNLEPQEVQSGRINLIDIGDEAEIITDPRRARSDDLGKDISLRLSDIFKIAGLNENIFGGQAVRAVTGRALSVLMQAVNNRIKDRQNRWTEAFQKMFKNIFILIENNAEKGSELVGGFYKVDIFFPGTLIRNITDEINKFNAKLQSQETTMKNLGVPSPKDEKKLMKRELKDLITMVEISRNAPLQLQLQQTLNKAVQDRTTGTGPQLREDENSGEEEPASAGGVPTATVTSPAGAVAGAGQRGGANSNISEGTE